MPTRTRSGTPANPPSPTGGEQRCAPWPPGPAIEPPLTLPSEPARGRTTRVPPADPPPPSPPMPAPQDRDRPPASGTTHLHRTVPEQTQLIRTRPRELPRLEPLPTLTSKSI